MYPSTEAPPQRPPTDADRSLLQGFGQAEADRDDDVGDTVEGLTADRPHPEDQPNAIEQTTDQPTADNQHHQEAAPHDQQLPGVVTDDVPHGAHGMDDAGDIQPDGGMGTTREDDEPAASDDPARHEPATQAVATDEALVDDPATDPHAGEPTSLDEPTDLQPGDGLIPPVAAMWAEQSVRDFRERWREAQMRFVDDPPKAADDTRNLVNEAVETLTAALASRRQQLDSWPANGDTEQYRLLVQRYRTFFERLLAL